MKKRKLFNLILALLILVGLFFVFHSPKDNNQIPPSNPTTHTSDRNGYYTSKDDVAEFIILYEELPNNYITKDEARKLGWVAEEGNLWEVTDKMSIGGDIFKNYEEQLPEANHRIYYECDIDYEGGYRNAKRLVFSNDGLIYYTDDHYETFETIVGE